MNKGLDLHREELKITWEKAAGGNDPGKIEPLK